MARNKKIKLDFSIDGVDKSIKNMEELEGVISDLNDEIKQADDTETFNKLAGQIAQATSKMKELELSMEGLDPEARASAFGAFAGGLAESATGAVALSSALGITNESSIAMVETLASGMAVAQAFKGGVEGIIAAQKLLKSSTVATMVATKGGAVAMRILNAVMMANPIFLLITALITFIALIAVFAAGTNEAAEEAEELNATLEDQAAAYEEVSAQLDRLDSRRQKELDNNGKLIKSELDLLKSKKVLTDAEKKRISELEGQLGQIDLSKFDSTMDNAQKKIGQLAGQTKTQFSEIDSIIRATDYEDGWNDIDYSVLTSKNAALRADLEKVLKAGFTDENIDSQIAAIEKLKGQTTAFTTTLSQNSRKLGDAEKEVFEDSIASSKNLNSLLTDLVKNADNYKNALTDKSTTKALQDDADAAEKIAEENKKIEKAQERQKEFARLQAQLKKELLKIDQQIALAMIDQSDLAGQEEAAILRRQQQLENELADVEGNSKRAKELREKLQKLADLELEKIRKDFNDKRVADEKATLEKINEERREAEEEWAQEEEDFYEEHRQSTQTQTQNDIDEVNDRYFRLITLAEQYGLDTVELERRRQEELGEIQRTANETSLQEWVDTQNKKLQTVEFFASGVNSLATSIFEVSNNLGKKGEAEALKRAKRQFKIQKALDITTAAIGTARAIIQAIAQFGPPPSPLGIAGIATAGIIGAAQIAAIASRQFEGGETSASAPSVPSGAAGGAPTSTAAAPTPPSLSLFGQALPGSEGQGEQEAGLRQQSTIKAVVVESDITNTQNRLDTYQQRSEIG